MDRKNQNLEFSQKMSTKSEECLERRSNNLFTLTRPPCASGGDIAVGNNEGMHCTSKNSSYQNLSYKSVASEEQFSVGEEGRIIKNFKNDCGAVLEAAAKQNFSGNAKRKKIYCDVSSKLKAELSKYKKELKEYNNTTKDLEEKYLKINFELNEMQQKHDRFVASRKNNAADTETYSDSSSTGSEYSLKRKYTQVFHRGSSFMTMLPPQSSTEHLARNVKPPVSLQDCEQKSHNVKRKQSQQCHDYAGGIGHTMVSAHALTSAPSTHKRHSKRKPDNKENEPPPHENSSLYHGRNQSAGLKDIYKVLKNVLDTNQKSQVVCPKGIDLKELQSTINNLQNEQAQFRNIIQQQQSCLHDYHSRCIKAQHIMQTQQLEIEKLNCNNDQLESEITSGIDQLRVQIDHKLRDVSHLPQMMREEQLKFEKVTKENSHMAERLRTLQADSSQLKIKMEELGRRKSVTINRLKAAERDLKIFKNYNTALKHEKRKLGEELQKLREQLDSVQNASKRTLSRQRDQNEKQRRDLQKRVFELELKLSRSQNSTTSLIQERDSLIAELQTQLNTLVHNFEVSQKHIRVLRRHIYSMSGGNVRSNSRLLNETV